jgi:sulfur relay protein TusB/DsrH
MKLISIISPLQSWQTLHCICQPDDAILLRQDAVYMCLRRDIHWPTTQLYALDSDLNIRQLQAPAAVTVITPAQWVKLCINAGQNLLWQN